MLQENSKRLCVCETIEDSQSCLDLFSGFMWKVIETDAQKSVLTKIEHEAKLMLQMMFTKVLHLKEIVNGISYYSGSSYYLKNIIDPGVVAIMSRNIFETGGLFNLIYRQPKTDNERDIIYNLWRHAGLRTRQRFKESFEATERRSVLDEEKQDMVLITQSINNNPYFLSIDEHNKKKILDRLDKGEFLIQFIDKKVKCFKWHELVDVMNLKKDLFDNLYSYFSLYTHPSTVSVFQFDDLFKDADNNYLMMTNFNIKTILSFIGVFIADYINFFPEVTKVFNNLSLEEQLIIDFHNMLGRNESYSITKGIEKRGVTILDK
jgi:hypothetical protein